MSRPRLPAPARVALWLLCPIDRRDDATEDLADVYEDRAARYGRLHAIGRLAVDIASVAFYEQRRELGMIRDVRFGWRLLRKHAGAVSIAVAGLGAAIGVVTTAFTLIDATLLRPYGIDDPSTSVAVGQQYVDRVAPVWPYREYERMRDAARLTTIEADSLESVRVATAAADDGVAGVLANFVSGGFMTTFGGRAAIGRTLDATDNAGGAPPVAVLSHHYWRSLGADPNMVGRPVWLNGHAVMVVGVLSPAFTGPARTPVPLWLPMSAYNDVFGGPEFGFRLVDVLGRLRPGAALQAAGDELWEIARSSPGFRPDSRHPAQRQLVLVRNASPASLERPGELRVMLVAAFGAVGLVLALACANAANLLLAGAVTRVREIGVRVSLGASRGRVARQLLTEGVMAGVLAGALGLLLAWWMVPLAAHKLALPEGLPLRFDWRVFGFAAMVAVICGVGASVSPMRHVRRIDVLPLLKSGGAASTVRDRFGFRLSFVGVQAAVSMLLLIAAGLLARTVVTMREDRIGFDAAKLIAVRAEVPSNGGRAPRAGFDEARYFQAAVAAVRALPAVEDAALAQNSPFGSSVERDMSGGGSGRLTMYVARTDAAYFATLGIPILRGRSYTDAEVAGAAPVALITDGVARRAFGSADPIGRSIYDLPGIEPNWLNAPALIIGVTADVIPHRVYSAGYATLFRPLTPGANPPEIIVRAANPAAVIRDVEAALSRVEPNVQVTSRFVAASAGQYFDSHRSNATLVGALALLATLLSLVGVYGVTAFAISRRTHEIGVRLACGAAAPDILRLMMRQALRPIAIGASAGVVAALAMGTIWESVVAGIGPRDPAAFGGAMLVLALSALAAVVAPARRAMRVDPTVVLRQD